VSFFSELRRRNVFKVAAAYAIVGWLLVQIADVFFPALRLPDWTVTFVAALLILGFPVALLLSWAYELTPEGVKRTESVPVSESITRITGRKLDFIIIGFLGLGVMFLTVDHYVLEEARAPAASSKDVDQASIAVLPFDNRSARAEDQFFVDGVHDDILTQLVRIGSLKVISRTSVMNYRDTAKNLRTIGDELGVATIVEGGVQRAGDSVRINVQLIDAATDEHLWAQTYDRELNPQNVFAIQSEIATAIATELEASLSPEDIVRLSTVPTQNTRAYDFYLRGNDYFSRPGDPDFMPQAVGMYSQAVAEDPSFALAWAALSRAHSTMHWYALDRTPQRLERAWEAAQRALAVDEDLPEAHLALGTYYDHGFRDYDSAQREFSIVEQAIPGDPELIEATAYMLRRMGDWTGALARLERLLDRDPRNPDLLMQLGITSRALRQYDDAEDYFDRALELATDNAALHMQKALLPWFRDGDASQMAALAANPPTPLGDRRAYLGWHAAIYERDYAAALGYVDRIETNGIGGQGEYFPKPLLYGWVHKLRGRSDLAEPAFRQAIEQMEAELLTNRTDPRMHIALAQALAGLGNHEAAQRAAREALDLMPRSRDDLLGAIYQINVIMGVFAPLNDVEATVAELDDHLTAASPWRIEGLLPDPRLDPVRDDPRFQALVEQYRQP